MSFKLYLSALAEISLVIIAAIADIDLHLRIVTGAAGIILAILTGIKFVQDIKRNRFELKLKKLELEKKDEEFRRYMEEKHK